MARRTTSAPPELPGYTFVSLLGSGGFSDVFLYEQHLPRRRVAVKVLLTEEVTVANRAAFVDEANVMAQLSAHPYIVSIFHADVASDDRPYLVMEYCSGPSLAQRYKREALPVVDVLRTGVRVASAVATAHAAGILHRDIKPANILANDYGWPALTDFGIASALDEHPDTQGAVAGTPDQAHDDSTVTSIGLSVPWSPPEMFADTPNPDARADVYSLAATLYTLLAGHTPFETPGGSNGVLDLIGRIERGLLTPMTRADVPASLVAVLRKGMALRREDRFASALELARALQRVELELGYSPTSIDVPNLVVDASVRAMGGDDDDATRARGVATIEAQPAPGRDDETVVRSSTTIEAQPAPPPAGPGTDAPLETIVRRTPAVAPPVTPQADVSAAAAPEPATRSNRVVLWVGGAVLALAGLGVGAALLFGGAEQPEPTASPSPATGGSAIAGNRVPSPQLVGLQPSAGSLTVEVANPDPQEGDAYIWRRVDRGASEPSRRVQDDTFTIEGVGGGGTVCFEVRIVRSGVDSAQPLEVCHPE